MTISPHLLNDALEGRTVFGSPHDEGAELVRLAAAVRRLEPPGPGPAARSRLRAEFEQVMAGGRRNRLSGFLLPWLGMSRRPRPLVQRLAAGFVLVAAAGSSGTIAAGSNPVDATAAVMHFAANVVANLDPAREDRTNTPTPQPSSGHSLGAAPTSDTAANSNDGATVPAAAPSATPTPPSSGPDASAGDIGAPVPPPMNEAASPGQTSTPHAEGTPDRTPTPGRTATPTSTPPQGGAPPRTPTAEPSGDPPVVVPPTVSGGTPSPAPTAPHDSDTPTPLPSPTSTQAPSPSPTPTPTTGHDSEHGDGH